MELTALGLPSLIAKPALSAPLSACETASASLSNWVSIGGGCSTFSVRESEAEQGKQLLVKGQEPLWQSREQNPAYSPIWKSGWALHPPLPAPFISALLPLFLLISPCLPETHISPLEMAKAKQERCHSGRVLKVPLDLCIPFHTGW